MEFNKQALKEVVIFWVGMSIFLVYMRILTFFTDSYKIILLLGFVLLASIAFSLVIYFNSIEDQKND